MTSDRAKTWAEAPLCIHIGLPKCASTFLQARVLFPHSEIDFLGLVRNSDADPYWQARRRDYFAAHGFLRAIKETEELAYDQRRAVELLPEEPQPGKVPVLSDEDLSFADKVDRLVKARRLAEIFPNARIAIVLRNPFDWVESYYLFELRHQHGYVSFEEWLERNWRRFEMGHLRVLRYAELIESYAELFGRDRIGLFLHEELRADPESFLRRFCGFLGVNPDLIPAGERQRQDNVRMPSVMYRVAGFAPWLYGARALVPAAMRHRVRTVLLRYGGGVKPEVSADWRKRIEDFCRPRMSALVRDWGLPLGRYGYPLESSAVGDVADVTARAPEQPAY
jgi:hypothetical protein